MRTYDVDIVNAATNQFAERIYGFYPDEWLANKDNVALTNEYGDVSLFERELPGVVTGHYFFHSRGLVALSVAKQMLEEIFTGDYDVKLIRGITPLDKLGARWLSKRLGFTSYGVIETTVGHAELVILTKQEWEIMNG